MLTPKKTNILVISIPRTGTHFTQNFLFEGAGRIVPVSGQDWLDGKNPISYLADHYLITEHFGIESTARIDSIIQADPNIKVVVPMQDLLQSFIDATLIKHSGFMDGVSEFLLTIDNLVFHPFTMDDTQPKLAKLNQLLRYCGITGHTDLAKYKAWPVINSERPKDSITFAKNPRAVMLRDTMDNLETARKNKDFKTIQNTIPVEYAEFETKIPNLIEKLQQRFGYGDLTWI